MGKQRPGHIIPANALPEWRRTGTRYAPPMPLAPRTSYDTAYGEQTADEPIARIRAAASPGAAPPSYTRSNFCLRHVSRIAVGRQQPREHLTVPILYCTLSLRYRGASLPSTAPLSSDTLLTVPMPPPKAQSGSSSSPRRVSCLSRSRAFTTLTDAASHNGT